MVSLDDMSAELLLNIATCLGDYSRPAHLRQQDLHNLSLTARRYRDLSQEVLHQWITLQPPKLMPSNQNRIILSPPGPPRVAKLARTLVERPDLGQKVRYLDLFLVWHAPSLCHVSGNCPRRHICGWRGVMTTCRAFIDSERCAWVPQESLHRWHQRISPDSYGRDSAFAGIILSSTPALEELRIQLYYWQDDAPIKSHLEKGGGYDFPLESCCPTGDPLASDFFEGDVEDLISTLDLSVVAGLAKLKHLRTTGFPSWDFITLPGLQSLHCMLHNGWLNFGFVGGPREPLLPITGSAEPQITRLSIEIMLTILNPHSIHQGRVEYFHKYLLPKLPMLKHLSIRLITRSGWKAQHFYTVQGMEYDHLMSAITAMELETLSIDTTEVCEEDFSRNGLLRAIQPARSLDRFKKLRRLVAPQEFFFSVYSDQYPGFAKCTLPSSIESLEVLDSTVAMKKYAKHLYDQKTLLPNLKSLAGWRDREEHHLVQDNRLKPDVAPMMTDMSIAWEDHCRDWGRFWNVSNSVWSQLEGVGVKVEWKQSHARGWREIES